MEHHKPYACLTTYKLTMIKSCSMQDRGGRAGLWSAAQVRDDPSNMTLSTVD